MSEVAESTPGDSPYQEVLHGITDALSSSAGALPENVHPLGFGDDVAAFLYNTPDASVVIKKYHDTDNKAAKINKDIAALQLAQGINGLEQLVASFPDQGVVITKYETGKDFTAISVDEAKQIPEVHVQNLAKTFVAMHEKGLATDPNAKNFIYDPDRGFSIIDFHRDEDGMIPQSLTQKFTSFIRALEYSPKFSLKDKYFDMVPADFAAFAHNVTSLERKWINILIDQFDNDQEAVRELESMAKLLTDHTEYAIQDQSERYEA